MAAIPNPADLPPGYCDRNASGNAFLAVSGATFFIATVLVPLRTYVRLAVVKNFWWDDFCLIMAYLILIPTYALLWQTASLGLGRHLGCFSLADGIRAGELQYVAEVLEIICTIFSRTSVALFVIRLFAVTNTLRKALYAYTVFMIISLAITAALVFAMCTPVQALWDPMVAATATCWSDAARNFVNYYNGAVSILSDLLLAMLPAYFLRKLQMSTRLKLGLAALMSIGMLPAVCAIARTSLASEQTAADPLYNFAILIVFGSLETSILIITAAIPALPPLFKKERPRGSSYMNKLPSDSSRNLHSPHATRHKSQIAQQSMVVPISQIGTAHTTPTPDDDIFLSSLEHGTKTDISSV